MTWIIEVQIIKKDILEWVAVKSSTGKTYEYATEKDAKRMAEICYPETEWRIKKWN